MTDDEIVAAAIDLYADGGLDEDEAGRLDWERAIDRIERVTVDLGCDADSPLIRRIKREVRKARKARA